MDLKLDRDVAVVLAQMGVVCDSDGLAALGSRARSPVLWSGNGTSGSSCQLARRVA